MSKLMIDDLMFCEEVITEDSNIKGGVLGVFDSLQAQAIQLGIPYQRATTDNSDTFSFTNISILPGGGTAAQSGSAAISVQ